MTVQVRHLQSCSALLLIGAVLTLFYCSTTFAAHNITMARSSNLDTPRELQDVDEATRQGASGNWDQLWKEGIKRGTRWDTDGSSPALVNLLKQGQLPKGKALVPGCGRGYDAIAFAAFGYHAVGMDLSDTAVKEAQAVATERNDELSGTLEFKVGNFFEHDEKYDVIWDLTFLCAINPAAREAWAQQMKALLTPQGVLVTYIFPIVEKEGGPPFAMSMDLVAGLLQPIGFKASKLEMLPDDLSIGKVQVCLRALRCLGADNRTVQCCILTYQV
eukprot:m.11476 g.11476  ORF g.11476 m.11476 type:complete len:274 (-) comp9822_c0_seq1:93-914(-)